MNVPSLKRRLQLLGATLGILSVCGQLAAQPVPGTLPQGGVVTQGAATIQSGGTAGAPVLNINQSSNRAVVNWNTFNVGSAATVNFNQPNAQSATLNRVNDLNPSHIFGHINAPGAVTLINSAGIYFSPDAFLDVGALTATSMQQSDADFMAGKSNFVRAGASGSVVNAGALTAALGGYIALLAPEVRNQGVIIAQQGSVVLAGGEAIRLNFDPTSRLASLTVTPSQIATLVENRSAVQAPDGLIILSATAVDRLTASVINSGQLNASSLTAKGGRVLLESSTIALTGDSTISAAGATGGGEILIGGDWQGSGSLSQATSVTMERNAVIDASATAHGDGGKVVLWSDVGDAGGKTEIAGSIFAHGAGAGTLGGKVETSGHNLALADSSNVSLGTGGQWLIDPADITISGSADSNHDVNFTPDSGASTAVVNVSTLLTALNAGTDVTVTTTNTGTAGAGNGDITVSNAVATTGTGAGALTLDAARNVVINANITLTGTGKAVTFRAGGNVDQGSNVVVTTAGGNAIYNSDRDGDLSGAVGLRSNAQVATNGGNIIMGGSTDPLTMPAYGSLGANPFGSAISIDNTNVILNAGGGNISLNGRTQWWSSGGVAANWGAQIKTTGSGNITIVGNGGDHGYGVGLDRTTISVQNGNINITSTATDSGSYAVVSRVGNKIESTGGGAINITGYGGAGMYFGGWGQNFVIGGNSASGNITLIADKFQISDTQATIKTTGTLTIKPYTAGTTIGIGGGSGTLQIPASYFTSNFINGFSGITIGDAASGNVTIGGTTAATDSLAVVTGGNITLNASASIATNQAGGYLALAAGGSFINNSGASAVSTTDGGATDRWVVYSSTPVGGTFGGLLSGNYAIWGETFASQAPASVASGNLYVFAAPKGVTITTTDATKTYGSAVDVSGNLGYSGAIIASAATYGDVYTGYALGDILSTLATASSTGSGAGAGVAAGPYAITASGAVANSGFSITYANTGTLTVNKAHLTVTADNASRIYGASNPTFTAVVSGFVNGEVLGTSGVTGAGSGTTTATSGTLVGTATITATTGTLAAANYDFTNLVNGTLTIGKAPLTLTADNQNRLYGAANPTLTTTLTGFVNGEVLATSGVTGSGTASTTATAGTSAGTATITAGLGSLAAGNYSFNTPIDGTLTIGKAHLTVTADNQNRLYGASNPSLTATLSGFVNGEVLGTSGVTGSGSATTAATTSTGVGTATITAGTGTLSANNYDFTNLVDGTLTIDKAHLTVTADNQNRLYGAANPTLTTTLTGFVNGEVLGTSGVSGSGSATTTATTTTAVGTATITAGVGTLSASNYDFTNLINGTLTINKAHLTAIADDQSRLYGASNPALTVTLTGFVNGEILSTSGVTGSGSATTTATTSTGVGTATIVAGAGTLSASNYDFTNFVNGTLTIEKAHLTVTADNQNRFYGAANPTLTTTITGFVNGEVLGTSGVSGSASATTTATPSTGVGTVTITAGAGTLAATNYDFTNLVDGALTINKAHLTVTADNQNRLYGMANPTLTTTLSGFVNGEVLGTSGVMGNGSATTNATTSTGVGTATITAAVGTLSASNYDFTNLIDGSLTINKAHLTVMADNQSRLYGASNPTLTATITGFVNGEMLGTSGVTGSGGATTAATSLTGVGTASIIAGVGTLTAANYDFTNFVNGTLTIDKAHLTVTANSGTRLYGAANPALTTIITGFVNGEVLGTSGVTGSGSATTSAVVSTGVGTATITAGVGTLAAGNYDFANLVDGILTINKAHLTVTADNQTRLYGAANPTLTTTLSGFVNGETLSTSGVTGVGSATTAATAGTGVGTSIIAAGVGSLNASNYDFTTLIDGVLTIGKASLTITANNDTKTYNGLAYLGGNGVAYTGFVNDEGSGVLGGALNYSGTSQGARNAGSYVIVPSGLTSGNYALNFINGTLTISPATLTVVVGGLVGNTTKVYDGTTVAQLAPVNYLLTGFASGEGALVTKTTGVYDNANAGSGKAVTATLSGSDYVPAGSTLLSNYSLPTTASGSIGTITPKAVTFTAPTIAKIYDGNTNAPAPADWLSQATSQLGVAGNSVTAIALSYDNKNVGAGKTVTPSSAIISDGNGGNNFTVTYQGSSGNAITRLQSVTWTGGATGNWFDAGNWKGGAVPDLANVANVVIPAGVNVTFGTALIAPAQAGAVQVESIGNFGGLTVSGGQLDVGAGGISLGSLAQTGGAMTVKGGVQVERLDQTGGNLSVLGNFFTTQHFSQSAGGNLTIGGAAAIASTGDPIALGHLTAQGLLTVTSAGGAITQTGPLSVTGSAKFSSGAGTITLLDPANTFGSSVIVSGSGAAVPNSAVELFTRHYARLQASDYFLGKSALPGTDYTVADIARVLSKEMDADDSSMSISWLEL